MSLLRFNIREFESVPDGFRFTHPETGHTDRHIHKEVWLKMIADHRRRMNLPPIDPAICEDQCCRLLPPGFCVYEDGSNPSRYINTRIGIDEIVNGTNVLIELAKRATLSVIGFKQSPLVDQSLAESRAKTCAACYANIYAEGCSPCRNAMELVVSLKGDKKTSADMYIENKACGVCKCSTQAQVWLRADILAKGVTPDMDELWPAHCWKKAEIDMFSQETIPAET